MELRASKQAKELNKQNMKCIHKLIAKFEDPATPPEEREKIRKTFEEIVAHADKQQQNETLFTKLVRKVGEK